MDAHIDVVKDPLHVAVAEGHEEAAVVVAAEAVAEVEALLVAAGLLDPLTSKGWEPAFMA
jgi:hypothetical protein